MIDKMISKKIEITGKNQPPSRFIWRELVLLLLACLLALPLLGMDAGVNASKNAGIDAKSFSAKPTKTPKKASGTGNAYDVIAAVNSVRASNGLSPFQINGALMSAAQAHSEYQAAIGSSSHTGSGGSDPKSRAVAAGYGGGAAVSVIENIYGGMNASPQQAVQWWRGDSLHLSTLLSTRYTDVGAGVATSGGVVYYTLDVGSVTGGSSGTTGATVSPATAVAFNPVSIATPNPDGSVVHVVQAGQTLWTIAASYKIALADLLKLNGFTENTFIYPGNKILIKPASVAAAINASALTSATPVTETGTPGAPEATSSATRRPKKTAGAFPEINTPDQATLTVPANSATPAGLPTAPQVAQGRPASSGPDPLLFVVAGLVLGGTGLLVVGNVLKHGGA
jgi:uncharacterized protein YkwD